jgi:hypothetical protein
MITEFENRNNHIDYGLFITDHIKQIFHNKTKMIGFKDMFLHSIETILKMNN